MLYSMEGFIILLTLKYLSYMSPFHWKSQTQFIKTLFTPNFP